MTVALIGVREERVFKVSGEAPIPTQGSDFSYEDGAMFMPQLMRVSINDGVWVGTKVFGSLIDDGKVTDVRVSSRYTGADGLAEAPGWVRQLSAVQPGF